MAVYMVVAVVELQIKVVVALHRERAKTELFVLLALEPLDNFQALV